jgi:hypothetical protein
MLHAPRPSVKAKAPAATVPTDNLVIIRSLPAFSPSSRQQRSNFFVTHILCRSQAPSTFDSVSIRERIYLERVETKPGESAMTGGNVAYLLLVIGTFLALSASMLYASSQTLEAEADPNMPTGKTNPDAQHDHD